MEDRVEDIPSAEDEFDQDDLLPLSVAEEERKLVTQPYDLGVRGLSQDIQSGRISLAIEYQRKYVWDKGKASRLIESLLLNVPIPVCYFAEDDDGVFEVIDGLQRLTAISKFLEDDFPLNGLSVLTELEGFKFSDLPPRNQRRLEGRTIRCIVITSDSHPDIKFDVFERLNTGAASLTAQELRNAVYRGPFNAELKEVAESPFWQKFAGLPTNRRMALEELALRFFALNEQILEYRPPIRQFLNSFMRVQRHSHITSDQLSLIEDCADTAFEALGPRAFTPDNSRTLNKALFDAVMIPLAHADRSAVRIKSHEFHAALDSLLNDAEFQKSIGRATADRTRVQYRVGAVADILSNLGVAVDLPSRFGLAK